MSHFTKIAAVWAALLLAPIAIIAIGFVGMASSLAVRAAAVGGGNSSAGQLDCLPAVAKPVNATDYTPEQLSHASTIVAVGKRMNVPPEGWVIALATAMQESGLRNLQYGDRDSLGLFQQRPSQGWGTPEQITTPAYAATQFYERLLALPGWQQMSLTRAAQSVQRSAFPLAYAKHAQAARYLVGKVGGSTCTGGSSGTWVIPVDGECTSGFGQRGGQLHGGLDIAAPIGATIVAPRAGTVIDAGPVSGYGLWVRIRHPDGAITTYGHNFRNLVEPGDTVSAGQPIAEVGNRGDSTGPHVHFEINVDGEPVPPARFYQQQQAPSLC